MKLDTLIDYMFNAFGIRRNMQEKLGIKIINHCNSLQFIFNGITAKDFYNKFFSRLGKPLLNGYGIINYIENSGINYRRIEIESDFDQVTLDDISHIINYGDGISIKIGERTYSYNEVTDEYPFLKDKIVTFFIISYKDKYETDKFNFNIALK